MALSQTLYNTFFRSNATMLGLVFGTAFGGSLLFNGTSDRIWDSINQGRQWKDIKHKYVDAAEE
ncbi:ubiquinol-cytochrome C reductase [Eremomyces bilateralis CBS 781.70]|uniref:Complex III subunit 9 n=1 Tax=Eremomyces bilateralis CBS 781.70 TaxID=1392243 RepID=A0A6G1FYR0_9PEZI|nr:ubiquinol-cytochrome C reductase [Eremomyces bilateralis CBS 781.70]KAF1810908.1 ubiquinol-cytochrome C reductase [Eremomyces bilateralis CBS 781.70]